MILYLITNRFVSFHYSAPGSSPPQAAAPQILSKLFPQTAASEESIAQIKKEQEKKDEEDRKEKEGSWKRMKLG